MSDELAVPSLHGWQVCLALAEQRLAQPDFRLNVRHTFDLEDEDDGKLLRWELDAQAQGLSIEVLRAGRDLVKLRTRLDGTLTIGGQPYPFEGASWDIVTRFQVQRYGWSCEIVTDLGDARRSENVTAAGGVAADLEVALRRWANEHGSELRLFGFDTRAGQGAGVTFDHFEVTTSFAEVASVRSSFLLLMSGANAPAGATPPLPLIDPHILPQGETAVLWVDRPTLERSSGVAVAQEAERLLALRPRALGIDMPGVTEALALWARSIIDNVSLPEPLVFTSMQMGKEGLKLSATPLSLDELDQLTASDLTVSRESLVQLKASELFGNCVLFHLDNRYREKLLGVPKPTLPAEIEALAKPQAHWLCEFGRLQVARMAKHSPKGEVAPYSRLSIVKIEQAINKLIGSEACKTFIDKLYPLAFCLVRPRLSLYMDERSIWLQRYREHMGSDQYIERLLALEEPVKQLHDDAAKLNLLDPDGKAVAEVLPTASALLLERHAAQNWKTVIALRPREFRAGLERVMTGLQARTRPGTLAEDWVATAGGAGRVVEEWMPALAAEAAHGQSSTLKDAARRFAASLRQAGAGAAHALSYAAEAAVVATLLAPIQAIAAGADPDDAQSFVNDVADWFVEAAKGGLVAAAALRLDVKGAVLFVAKGARWVATKAKQGAQVAEEFFKTTAGKCFAVAGAVLSLVSLGFAIADFVSDLKKGHVVETVLDGVSALVSLLSAIVLIAAPAGPWGAVLMVAGLLIGTFRLLWTLSRKSEEELAAEELTSALLAEGMA